MAAPSLVSRTWSGDITEGTTGATNTATCNLPATINAGDRLIAIVAIDGAAGPGGTAGNATSDTDSTGDTWTVRLASVSLNSDTLFICEKIAHGDEGGGTLNLTHAGGAQIWLGVVLRISGAHASDALEIASDATTQTATTAPDPPEITASGAKDWLAIAVCKPDSGSNVFSAHPTGYEAASDGVTFEDTGGSGGGTALACPTKALSAASSEDPDAFAHANTGNSIVATLLVPPAAAASTILPFVNAIMGAQ